MSLIFKYDLFIHIIMSLEYGKNRFNLHINYKKDKISSKKYFETLAIFSTHYTVFFFFFFFRGS